MGSKAIVFLVLFLAMVFSIASEVAARDLTETSNALDTSTETNGAVAVNDAKYGGGNGGYQGGGNGGYQGGGHGGNGGSYGGGRGGNGGGRGGRCRYGCCGRNYYRGGCRCCTYAGEKVDTEPQSNP